jgi:gallate dioxygenase
MTAIATMLFEDTGDAMPPAESDDALRARAANELAGVEQIEGTYPFTIDRAVKGFRINHFLHSLIEPAFRKRFVEDQEGLFAESDLSDEEKELIRSRNWIGMIHYGVIFFMLEKMAAVLGIGNIDVYAAFKGLTVPEFQKTRNAAITYSVAGKK